MVETNHSRHTQQQRKRCCSLNQTTQPLQQETHTNVNEQELTPYLSKITPPTYIILYPETTVTMIQYRERNWIQHHHVTGDEKRRRSRRRIGAGRRWGLTDPKGVERWCGEGISSHHHSKGYIGSFRAWVLGKKVRWLGWWVVVKGEFESDGGAGSWKTSIRMGKKVRWLGWWVVVKGEFESDGGAGSWKTSIRMQQHRLKNHYYLFQWHQHYNKKNI
jgi:hypothetical protein